MKRFLLKISSFASLLILFFILCFWFLPSTPRASQAHIFSAIKKDSLLINTPSPRIIFVGGSNLSFGLNSQEIKDSLNLNPINTAIHGALGIQYILKSATQHVKKGDIIVFVPEYGYSDWDWGSTELLRTVIDVNREYLSLLSKGQMRKCFPYIGAFVISKFNLLEYIWQESDIYSVNSFNEYGDVDAHWYLENRHDQITPTIIDIEQNILKVMPEIKQIADKLIEKGCVFFISYPCFQETSFNRSKEAIRKIEKEYHANGFAVLGTPERYMLPDSLLFNGSMHPNKQGVDLRTKLLIEDLRISLSAIPNF